MPAQVVVLPTPGEGAYAPEIEAILRMIRDARSLDGLKPVKFLLGKMTRLETFEKARIRVALDVRAESLIADLEAFKAELKDQLDKT